MFRSAERNARNALHCVRRISSNRITLSRARSRNTWLISRIIQRYISSYLIVWSKINGAIRSTKMIKLFRVQQSSTLVERKCRIIFTLYTRSFFAMWGEPTWINFRLQDSALDYPLRNTSALNSINYAAISNIGQICRIRRIPNSCRILAVHPNHL